MGAVGRVGVVGVIALVLLLSVVGWYWSREPEAFSVRDLMASLKAEYDNFSLKGKLFGVK